jgi:type II secretion system (T2SS) protein G
MDKSEWQISREFIRFLLVGFLVWMCLWFFVFPHLAGGGPAKVPSARNEEKQLYLSLENYKQAFGNYPTGENANIVKVLAGGNPQKLQLFYLSVNSTNGNGELIDPWKIPYKFIFDGTNSYLILSAGIDKKFGDADDIIFNSVSNDFVKP